MPTIFLYDSTTIDQMVWPETQEAQCAKNYLMPMMKEGVTNYIHNVKTELYLLVYGDYFFPITVNETEYDNSYVVSNYSGIVLFREFLLKKHPYLRWLIPILKGGEQFLQWLKINRCVIFNNWLLTTNLYPHLSTEDINAIVLFLIKKFPHAPLMFRNIEFLTRSELFAYIKTRGFHTLKMRTSYFYDPRKKEQLSAKALSHHRKDKKLIEKLGLHIVRNEEIKTEDLSQLLSLYNHVYCEKHTFLSPQFTLRFLENVIYKNVFHFIGVKKSDKIEGIAGYFIRHGSMVTGFFGYDTQKAYSGELYRLLSILLLEEAERHGVILNDGSGGEATKSYRGLQAYPEYLAIYDRHLPFHRRFFWNSASFFYSLTTRPAKKR